MPNVSRASVTQDPLSPPGYSGKVIASIGLFSGVSPLATDMYLSTFPQIRQDLHTTNTKVQLTLTVFMIGLALGQLFIGPLSDKYGRKKPLIIATTICLIASFITIWTPTIEILIASRAIQGFTGAAGMVLGRAVVSDRYSGAEATKIFSLTMLVGGLAPILAPILGGFLAKSIGWQGIFAVLTGLIGFSLFLAITVIPESLPVEKRKDHGAFKSLLGIKHVLSIRTFFGYTLMGGFLFTVLFSYVSASPFIFQTHFKLTPFHYSLFFALNSSAIFSFARISGLLAHKVNPRKALTLAIAVINVGVTIMALDIFVLGFGFLLFEIGIITALGGIGIFFSNFTGAALDEVRDHIGSGSAALGSFQFLVSALFSPIAGGTHAETGKPMLLVMIVVTVISNFAFFVLSKPKQGAKPKQETS